jgi:hypothetical protein
MSKYRQAFTDGTKRKTPDFKGILMTSQDVNVCGVKRPIMAMVITILRVCVRKLLRKLKTSFALINIAKKQQKVTN